MRYVMLVLIVACGCSAGESWRLVRVVDGDTIVARRHCGCERRVRLLCVDAPERGEPGYAESAEVLRRLLEGRRLRLEGDAGHRDVDCWGRLLRYVWAGGRLANAELVRRGAAVYDDRWGASCYESEFRADF